MLDIELDVDKFTRASTALLSQKLILICAK